MRTNRRDLLTGTAAAALAVVAARSAEAAPAASSAAAPAPAATTGSPAASVSVPPAFAGAHAPRPLPFDPTKLVGLSERLVRSHWENNYGGAVKALNALESRLATLLADPETPPFVYGPLKREHLLRRGSVVLHDLYFANLGGDGRPGGDVQRAIARDFGSHERWQADFQKTAMSLAGGSGWVVLASDADGTLHNHWLADHAHSPAGARPLLVLDMYEHAFQMDYGAAAAKYVEAFWKNVDWSQVDRRLAGTAA
jgi:Fe-Mn family superoxide dismutase